MNRRSPVVRGGLFALAVLQLLVTGAASWADARLDAGGPKGPVHLETRSTQACAPVHPADCILHRFLSSAGKVVRPIATDVALAVGQVAVSDLAELLRSDLQQRQPDIRGPPLS